MYFAYCTQHREKVKCHYFQSGLLEKIPFPIRYTFNFSQLDILWPHVFQYFSIFHSSIGAKEK